MKIILKPVCDPLLIVPGVERKKDEREKPLLFNLVKVVRFLISPKKMKVKIEVNKISDFIFCIIIHTIYCVQRLENGQTVSH